MNNIVFIAPRFHTNQFYLTKYFFDKKHPVYFFSEKEIGIANTTIIKPILLIEKIVPFLKFKYFKINHNYKFLNTNKTTTVIRDPFYFKTLFYIFFFRKTNIIFYSQVDLSSIIFFKSLFYRLYCCFFNAKWISPISSSKIPFYINDFMFHLPFVIDYPENLKKINNLDSFKIGIIAKFQERKNYELLINALIALKNILNLKLIIVGSYHDVFGKSYFNKIVNLLNSNNISYDLYVNVSHEESLKILSSFDIFVLPSTKEPAAYSIVESFAHGVPVIVSSDCGNASYVYNNDLGKIFNVNSLDSFSNTILNLSNNLKKYNSNYILNKSKPLFSTKANSSLINKIFNV